MTGTPLPAQRPEQNTTFIKRLILVVIMINLSLVTLTGVSLYYNRLQHTEQAKVTARNLSHVLEQYIIGVLDPTDLVLSAIVPVARQGAAGGSIDGKALDAYLQRQHKYLTEVHDLRIVDARGESRYDFGLAQKPLSVANRDYFQQLRTAPPGTAVISRPILGRHSGKWMIISARRVERPDGAFAGAVIASISLEQFYRTFSAVNIGRHGSIVLRDADLGLVVRYPNLPGAGDAVGSSSSAEFRDWVRSGQRTGTYRARSYLDRVERVFSYRGVAGYPFYVVVGLAVDDYLADWRGECVRAVAFVLLFCLVSSSAAWLVCREWQRKNAAMQDLQQQKALYHTVADHTHAWEFWLDPEGRFVYSSPSCKRITGYGAADFDADPHLLLSIVLPEYREKVVAHRHDAGTGVACDGFAFQIRHQDGSVRWLEHTCQPIIDASGAYLGTRGSNRDITVRKQMELALLEIGEHFHQIFMQNWDAVLLLKQDTLDVIDANPAMIDLFGYSLAELHVLGPWHIVPDLAREFQRIARHAAPFDVPFLWQTTGICKDGTQLTISAKIKLIALGDINTFYCSFRDISERVRLEKERRENQAKLIHANKMTSLGMLVSGIAHEINNPNQYISVNAALLEDIWKDAEAVLARQYQEHGDFSLKGLPFGQACEAVPRLLTGLVEGSRRISTIVSNLKDFSRDDSGRQPAAFDLNKTVRDAVQILTHHIHKYTNDFRLELAEGLPMVQGRPQQIEQVLVNLIINALQALPDKTRWVRVHTALEQESDTIVLTVSDQGKGMTESVLERITEPFFSTKLDEGGTGLGLSISATIIKEHGGIMVFDSEPGVGTTATIRLRTARSTTPGADCRQAGREERA